MTKSKFFTGFAYSLLLFTFLILFSACAQNINIDSCVDTELYGFWSGGIHGIIAPFSFIVSLFNENVTMYAANNNGSWYDLGFVLGSGILFGGSCKARKKR